MNFISTYDVIKNKLQGNSLLGDNKTNISPGIVNHFFIDAVHLRSSSFVPLMIKELQKYGVEV
jgi:hypothetical protein